MKHPKWGKVCDLNGCFGKGSSVGYGQYGDEYSNFIEGGKRFDNLNDCKISNKDYGNSGHLIFSAEQSLGN